MTQKELLYLEDACCHEENISKILEETAKNLQDNKLVEFIDNEISIHKNILDSLKSLLEDKVNG